jgi:hypothetical protein
MYTDVRRRKAQAQTEETILLVFVIITLAMLVLLVAPKLFKSNNRSDGPFGLRKPERESVPMRRAVVGGCSIAAKIDVRTEYQKSVADYRVCLDAHPWELKTCDIKGLAYRTAQHD